MVFKQKAAKVAKVRPLQNIARRQITLRTDAFNKYRRHRPFFGLTKPLPERRILCLCYLCTTLARNLVFPRDSRLVLRAALKHHSARQGLGSKTVEQERTEGTEDSRLSLFAPVL